ASVYTPPPALQISNVQTSSVGSSSAVITWATNNSATSRVDYGTSTAYGSNVADAATLTSHSLTLTGLTPSTTYHYQVSGTDTSAGVVLPANATLTNGQGTFSATLIKAGAQTITATDTTTATITGTLSVTVRAAAAFRATLTVPSSVAAMTPFNVTLAMTDRY